MQAGRGQRYDEAPLVQPLAQNALPRRARPLTPPFREQGGNGRAIAGRDQGGADVLHEILENSVAGREDSRGRIHQE